MKLSDLPARFNIPFANSAGGGYVRSVPQASQVGIQDGAASLETGYPPLNFLPVGAGGVPPFGQDMNGILKQITQWSRWQGAGGLSSYNSDFSTAIGGYPQGAILAGTSAGAIWLNLVDDNTANPDTGGAHWLNIAAPIGGPWVYASATGTANALVAAFSPVISANAAGTGVRVKIATTNTGAATLNAGPGALPIQTLKGTSVSSGDLPAGAVMEFICTGTAWMLLGPAYSETASTPAFSLSMSVNTLASTPTFPSGVFTTCKFTTVDVDVANGYSTSTGQYTVAADGYYSITWAAGIDASANNNLQNMTTKVVRTPIATGVPVDVRRGTQINLGGVSGGLGAFTSNGAISGILLKAGDRVFIQMSVLSTNGAALAANTQAVLASFSLARDTTL